MKDNTLAEDKDYSHIQVDIPEYIKYLYPEYNKLEKMLGIISSPHPGYYCHQCSHELIWLGTSEDKTETESCSDEKEY